MPAHAPALPALAHLVASADFERVLRERSRGSTAQFSLHHLDAEPTRKAAPPGPRARKLSTTSEPASEYPVEDSPPAAPLQRRIWVGAVVPKRHARRAVTRSLLKREIYAAAARHRDALAPGLWIVRLRAPIDRARFPSAASPALRRSVRAELDALLAAAVASSGIAAPDSSR
jgi:ribonuclease P protein component